MWETLLIWISIVGFILAISKALERVIKPDVRKELVNWLITFRDGKLSDIVASCNRIFLRLFDQLYYKDYSETLRILWLGIISGISCIFVITLISKRYGLVSFSLESLLVFSFGLGIFFGIWIHYYRWSMPVLLF